MILIFIVFLVIAPPVWGQTAPPARVGVGNQQKRLSLGEAIQNTLAGNLEIEIERTRPAAAGMAVEAARGFYDPTFRWLPSLDFRNTPTSSVLQGSGGKVRDRIATQNFYYRQKFPWAGSSFGADFENTRQTSSNPFLSLDPLFSSRLVLNASLNI